MQGGRDPFFGFGDPFGGLGGFGGQRSLISNFFGGRNPFDDPFFTRPFGSTFESSFFGSNGGPFMNPQASGFLEPQPPQLTMPRGPVIEELNSDDEKDEKESEQERNPNPRKHGRSSKEPIVEDPDNEITEKRSKHISSQNDIVQMQHARSQSQMQHVRSQPQVQHVRSQPQMHSFTFQSSSVSYGGANGAYYTSSMTRRSGGDGLTFEELKEADSSTRQATHRVSKGIHDKGHSVTRKLKSDGHVDTMQTLHNINEDELSGFEEAWKGNAMKHLPVQSEGFANGDVLGSGSVGNRGGGWALPSTDRAVNLGRSRPDVGGVAGSTHHSGRARSDLSDGTGTSRGRSYKSAPSNQGNKRY